MEVRSMGRWAQAPIDRDQVVLFAPTLDASISADHSVRLFDEALRRIDFSSWEARYVRCEGQPPIHPRVMAGVILYGLSLGIRSSRRLEDATCNRIDFIWLCEGRSIDHSTLAGFRTRFKAELKEMFRQIGRVAIAMGMVNLNQLALDGTVKRSNNSRYATARRAGLERKLAALDEQVEKLMREAEQTDEAEGALYGQSSPTRLPKALSDLKRRQARLAEALKRLEELEHKRAGRKDVSAKGPAVPTTDPDSAVLPNKGGGHAPNYTIVTATDGQSGIILSGEVLGDNHEPGTVLPAVDQVKAQFGQAPQQVLADSNFNSGPNLAGLAEQGVEPLMPERQAVEKNPAEREDPTQAVPPPQRQDLPMNPQNKVLDKQAFLYDSGQDCYFCPMGRALAFAGKQKYCRDGSQGWYRVYECADCAGCELAARCVKGKRGLRRVVRDEYEPLREQMRQRMRSEEGKRAYRRRSFLCETPFAVWGTVMNVRQMLLRGIEKVKMEVDWICSAYNLRKIVAELRRRRLTAAPAGL
jgi:transposase